jgi:hypothetical protein
MNRSSRTSGRSLWILLAGLAFLVIACAVGRRSSVAPSGWKAARGPVVPHDTFPADCSLCHAGGSWHVIREDFTFDHARETGVPLEGAHAAAECLRCHNDRGPVELFARRGCAGCHEDVHLGKLGADCTDCHDQDLWRPRRQIDLHARTRFPLVGAHAATGCFRCHPGAEVGNFDRTPIECVSCHADDLARAVSPNHQTSGFVDDCQRCHIPTSWTGSGFNHSTFPLTGAHATAACSQCHVGGVYAGTPRDCASCHMADYDGTNDPDHAAAGFPTSCQDCHGTATWNGASFNHPFPLTGPHNQSCSECHQTPGDYMSFSCTHCHEHSQSSMDSHHSGVSGYSYDSAACYSCHPNGHH